MMLLMNPIIIIIIIMFPSIFDGGDGVRCACIGSSIDNGVVVVVVA